MPPWHAVQPDGFVPLRDARRLSDRQIATLRAWADAGAPAGDFRRLAVPPLLPHGWQLGVPDLVLTLPRPVPIPASGRPFTRTLRLSIDLPIDRWIAAIDFQPTTSVQRADFFMQPSEPATTGDDAVPGLARAIDHAKTGLGLAAFRESPDTSWGGLTRWSAGLPPRLFPEGTALRLPTHSDLVVRLHLTPAGQAQSEDGRVAVYFAKLPFPRELTGLQLPPAFGRAIGLDIPPGADRHLVRDTFELPVEVDAYAVRPHARDLARSMRLIARLPGNKTRGLLQIDRWDPRWEDTYYFQSALRLPRGTIIEAAIEFNNSASNPRLLTPPQRDGVGRRLRQ